MLSHQNMTCFCFKVFKFENMKIQTSHMLMAQPSTYDMFALLKKNGYVDG